MVKGDITEGKDSYERLVKLSEDIQNENIWDERKTAESKAELQALGERHRQLHENLENKQTM